MNTTHWDWSGTSFFGMKLGRVKVLGQRVVILQAFNRGTVGGVSLLQVGRRHLIYVGSENGSARICVGFIWLTRQA